MHDSLLQLRADVDILSPFVSGTKPRLTKNGRVKTITAIHNALSRKHILDALTRTSRREMIRGPTEQVENFLGWAELSSVVLNTLDQVYHETVNSRSLSKSGSSFVRGEYMTCFLAILKLGMQHGPQGVLRHIVRPFLSYAHQWLSEPPLRLILADQVWQSVRDLLLPEVNRALLLPAYIRTWVDTCFEQLTGRGALYHSSSVATNIAGEVLQILAQSVLSYDTLSQSTKGIAPSKMRGSDFGYSIIAERCCMILIVSTSMSSRNAKEVQSVAFRTLATVLNGHALDVIGSSALKSLIFASLQPLLGCWSEKKHHSAAVSYAKILVLLAPTSKALVEAMRKRLLLDLKDDSSSATTRAGHELSLDYVHLVATCFTFGECLDFAGSPDTPQSFVVLWLRASYAILSQQVLKQGTNVFARTTDVLHQCSHAAATVTKVLAAHGNLQGSDYMNMLEWCTLIVDVAAPLANKIYCSRGCTSSADKALWQALYKELQAQALKAEFSAGALRTSLWIHGHRDNAGGLVSRNLGLLCSLDIVDDSIVDYASGVAGSNGPLEYLIARLMPSTSRYPGADDVTCFRNLLCRTGLGHHEGGHIRSQLISTLLDCWNRKCGDASEHVRLVENASASSLALIRGECLPNDIPNLPGAKMSAQQDMNISALHSFYSFFGLAACSEHLEEAGDSLVCAGTDHANILESSPVSFTASRWPSESDSSVATSRYNAKPKYSRHFIVDSHLTMFLEDQMLQSLTDLVKQSSDNTRNPAGPDICQNGTAQKGLFEEFADRHTLRRGLCIVLFIVTYLFQGIQLGLVSLSDSSEPDSAVTLLELAKLLTDVLTVVANSRADFLIENSVFVGKAIENSARLQNLIDSNIDTCSQEDLDGDWVIAAKGLQEATVRIATSVMASIMKKQQRNSHHSTKLIQNMCLESFTETPFLSNEAASGKRSPSTRAEEKPDNRPKKQRRESATTSDAMGRKSPNALAISNDSLGAKERVISADDSSEDSDEAEGFANENNNVRGSTIQLHRGDDILDSVLVWSQASAIVNTSVGCIPACIEKVTKITINGLNRLENIERVLSPDGFERAAVVSSLVDPSALDSRQSIWDVLFAIGTKDALTAVGKDIVGLGQRWKDLDQTGHAHLSFYADLLEIGKKKQYPVTPGVENARQKYLKYASFFFQTAMAKVSLPKGTELTSFARDTVQLMLSMLEVSEYFRKRHAFRMPRATRIAYLKFGCAVVKATNYMRELRELDGSEIHEKSLLVQAAHSIQRVLSKFFTDSECLVRVAAAKLVPRAIASLRTVTEGDLHEVIDNSLPEPVACSDSSEWYGELRQAGEMREEDIAYNTWSLSDAQQEAFLLVRKSFLELGAAAKGYSALMTLSEFSCLRRDISPHCIIQIISRVTNDVRFFHCCYMAIVRLCVTLRYRSPSHFFEAYSRIVLPMWFQKVDAVEEIYDFPASLFINTNHHSIGVTHDWIRKHQASILPYLLVQEKTTSLNLTTRFAEALGEDVKSLLKRNVAAFSLLFPMHFAGGLQEKGKLLWVSIDSLLDGEAMSLMFKHKAEVIDALLRSVSTCTHGTAFSLHAQVGQNRRGGFVRDASSLKPPLYDALVIALTINHLFAPQSLPFVVQRSVMKGSLFAEVRDERSGALFADQFLPFAGECKRKNTSLLRILILLLRFFDGPPSPQPGRNRFDAFLCVGMLWRMSGSAILVSPRNERLLFYRLMGKGFQHKETVEDAAWLLSDVHAKLGTLQRQFPKFAITEASMLTDESRNSHLTSMTCTKERQIYELLSTISPVLVAILTKKAESRERTLNDIALRALHRLLRLSARESVWPAILANGPFPNEKTFKEANKVYQESRTRCEAVCLSSVDSLMSSIVRFQGIYKRLRVSEASATILASLEEVRKLLNGNTVNEISKVITSESWLKSNGMDQRITPFISGTISCLVDIIRKASWSHLVCGDVHAGGSRNETIAYRYVQRSAVDALLQEVGRVLSVLGLLRPLSMSFVHADSGYKSIPARSKKGCYEEVESGIGRGIHLLHSMLQSDLPLQASTALLTLALVLRTPGGRRAYSSEKHSFESLAGFRTGDRVTHNRVNLPKLYSEADTGYRISASELPTLLSSRLWDLLASPRGIDTSVKVLCTVLARTCRSDALQALSSACFSSHDMSCQMLPYLLMDVICDLDRPSLSRLSKLFDLQILRNRAIPSDTLRIFVHALDVLCQIGLTTISSQGISSWVCNVGDSMLFPHYYLLEIPYLEAAQAALHSKAYFSALRFSHLYVDQRIMRAELRHPAAGSASNNQLQRRSSSSPGRDLAVERAGRAALGKVKRIVRQALLHISEPDGIRAFGESSSLASSAASIASLDGDWSRSLAASDIVARNSGESCRSSASCHGSVSACSHFENIDLRKEVDIFRSFIGLGTVRIATDYWDGLRRRTLESKILQEESYDMDRASDVDQLNELRYAAAWKLGQWESPRALPQRESSTSGSNIASVGFHKAVYHVLHSLESGRIRDVIRILFLARRTVLQKLREASTTVSSTAVFEAASCMHVFQILERGALQNIKLNKDVGQPPVVTGFFDCKRKPDALSKEERSATRTETSTTSARMVECVPHTNEESDCIAEMLGSHYGVDENEFGEGLILSRDAFHTGVLAEDLPVILTRSMKRNDSLASISATISARVLSHGGVGAWARAASSLGTLDSVHIEDSSREDCIAWKMQECRLQWLANHNAQSKKEALMIMKGLILKDLGGIAKDLAASDVSDNSKIQPSLSWHGVDISEDTLALLRSEACCLAAKWCLEMRTHEPMDLFRLYLESGLTAASKHSQDHRLIGRAHFAMASFADAQISNIDTYRKNRTYDEMVSSVKEMERKVDQLRKMKDTALSRIRKRKQVTSSGRNSRSTRSDVGSGAVTDNQIGRDLELLIRNDTKKARQERSRLEKLDKTYQRWQILACTHFAASLRHGSTQDLRAAFRMVALWIDSGFMRSKITVALVNAKDKASIAQEPINVPVVKLVPLAPQLASRLSCGDFAKDVFQQALSSTLTKMASEFPAHCLWQLLALSNGTRDAGNQEKYSSLYRGDRDKKDAANGILRRLEDLHGDAVVEMRKVADAYILLSETDAEEKKRKKFIDMRGHDILQLRELVHVPVPTIPVSLNSAHQIERIPHIVGFEKKAVVCSGLSKPLHVVCLGSDGERYPQMVKGRDDLRGDAVMEQMFTILNSLLEKNGEAGKRSLHIRTYRVIPLSPFSGIMQFVRNTKQLKEVLTEKDSEVSGRSPRSSLHERYRPDDRDHSELMENATLCLRQKGGGVRKVIEYLASIWHDFQPVFRFFFVERWPDPAEWFSHQLSYSRSVAVMSIVGFILGLGDRHLSNILLDISSGEVVHIDFGIAFELGKLLPTPEHMPFRLTRDIVDGFGIAGVEGVFRRCSEITLSVMRENKDVILTVIQVLLHDPMYSWALAPEEVLREQLGPQKDDQENAESDGLSRSLEDSSADAVARNVKEKISGSREAHRALNRISEKLDGLEGTERLTVEAHVARLVDEAQAFHVLASVFPGWCPWL